MSEPKASIENPEPASTATFLTALTFNAAVFAAQLAVFTILLGVYFQVYQPRALKKYVDRLSFSWPLHVIRADYSNIIQANGLDAYFFVRFLRLMAKIFFPIWIVSWAVLLPLTSVKSRVAGNKGLDLFVFGNVEPRMQERYAGHIILVYFFTAWILWNISKEMRHFIITRQHHLIDSVHAKTVQANTILVTGIPIKYLTRKALSQTYGSLPGGVKKIWINRNLKELPEIYDRRMKACNKLESAETKFLKTIAQQKVKNDKKGAGKDADLIEQKSSLLESVQRPTHKLGFLGLFGEKVDSINWAREEIRVCTELLDKARVEIDAEDDDDIREQRLSAKNASTGSTVKEEHQEEDEFAERDQQDSQQLPQPTAEEQIAAQSRPTPPQSSLHQVKDRAGRVGGHITQATHQAAQATTHAAQQAAHATSSVAQQAIKRVTGKGAPSQYPPLNSAFITFHKQISAHLAVQALAHHEPYRMSSRYIEVSPVDVVWSNLGLNPYEVQVRRVISWGLTLGLIIFWAIPVVFVGTLSNITSVCTLQPWLEWLCDLPAPVKGIIQGILPAVLLAVLMMLLPIVLRLLARFEGIPQDSACELSLMTRFFLFQVIHSFLIVTISSGLFAALTDLSKNPTSIPTILATQLPKASNFFLTYILLQLAGTAGGFLQIVTLVVYYVKLILLGSTPRSTWSLKYGKRSISSWGTLFPRTTLICVIALGYSIISPIINGLAFVTFALMFLLYKYLFLWIMDQSDTIDTGGMFFPKAIQHLFVGLYIQQICLCALFFLARDENGSASAIAQGALMVVLLGLTAFTQAILNNSYGPLLNALPLTLADKMYSMPPPTDGPDREGDYELQPVKDKATIPEKDLSSFAHPAVRCNQRTVWLPNDVLGLGPEEAKASRDGGVDAVCGDGAEINSLGKLVVEENPGRPGNLGE